MDKIPITVTHPRTSIAMPAEVAPQCPARVVLEGLQRPAPDGTPGFLEAAPAGRPYVLTVARTNVALTPETTMAQAGVVANDVLTIDQMGQGA
jgi:hypothetical protein